MNTISDYTNLSVVDMGGYVFTYVDNKDNAPRRYTIVDALGNVDPNGQFIYIC